LAASSPIKFRSAISTGRIRFSGSTGNCFERAEARPKTHRHKHRRQYQC
jgi:hypothetical protein